MKVKGKILSLLCLLGISFSAFAVVVVCPDVSYLNADPQFRQNRSQHIISGLGSVSIFYFNKNPNGTTDPNGTTFGSWKFVQIFDGGFNCEYEPSTGPGPRGRDTIFLRSNTKGWKQGKNSPPWNNSLCKGDRLSCYMTND